MAPIEAPVPKALAATGHRGVIYRDPYGVALIIGPFNGPLLLLIRPAITLLAESPRLHFRSRLLFSAAIRALLIASSASYPSAAAQ
jgi:acyl-CoA reductase-like NAD-dependent aldehyde dehydrogenase